MNTAPPKGGWISLTIGIVFLIWLALLVTNETTAIVESIRPILPAWYPTTNLVLAPLLAVFAAGPLPMAPAVRLFASVFLLWSLSTLYLAYRAHPWAYTFVVVVVIIEAFWMIPKWNAHCRRERGS